MNSTEQIFQERHIKILHQLKKAEHSLELIQILELAAPFSLVNRVTRDMTQYSPLVPLLALVDCTIMLGIQTFLLTLFITRLFVRKGPLYTELSGSVSTHAILAIHNLFTTIYSLFLFPLSRLFPSLSPQTTPSSWMFTKLQNRFLSETNKKISELQDDELFVLPITYTHGAGSLLPVREMHATYLMIEKKNDLFNTYWINRPNISSCLQNPFADVCQQVQAMIQTRFPRSNALSYRIPPFTHTQQTTIAPQGTGTNCVLSNLFALFDAMSEPSHIAPIRHLAIREFAKQEYDLYKHDPHIEYGDEAFPQHVLTLSPPPPVFTI